MRWEEVTFQRVELRHPAIDAMLTALRTNHCMGSDDDGGVLLACFEPCDRGEFDKAAKVDRHPDENSFVELVRNPSIRGLLDDLQIVPEAEVDIPGLQVIPLRVAEERLAHRLRSGGFLDRMHWSNKEVRRLTSGLIGAVLQNRLWRVTAATTYEPWTKWFYGIACDLTVLLYGAKSRRFIILAITDSD